MHEFVSACVLPLVDDKDRPSKYTTIATITKRLAALPSHWSEILEKKLPVET